MGFEEMATPDDANSDVTIDIRRDGCPAHARVKLAAGDSATALGLTITIRFVTPTKHGIPPQVTFSYRVG